MGSAAWHVIVPLKDTTIGKSRLGGEPADRAALSLAMALDTVSAITTATVVASVLVVCDRAEEAERLAGPEVATLVVTGAGMNGAIESGERHLRERWGLRTNLAVLPADLPFLRGGELDAVLMAAARAPRAVVGDRFATGTTLLTALGECDLLPSYGPGSLARHRQGGATELSVPVWSGIRRDVDLARDLVVAPSLGPRTRALLESTGG